MSKTVALYFGFWILDFGLFLFSKIQNPKSRIQNPSSLAYLGLGSNMRDPKAQIEAALAAIDRVPTTRVLRRSPLYGSKPWGRTDQPDFVNMVAEVATGLQPHTLLRHLKSIEREQGRTEGERWGPRPIDLDILLFGNRHLRTASLQVPHPRMWERAFVLRPLADLRPDLAAPDGRPLPELLATGEIASQGVWPYGVNEATRNE
jgi:2-amino-4-hydroxy-6-hydroxymethyldihydropteridine diphosphokinase